MDEHDLIERLRAAIEPPAAAPKFERLATSVIEEIESGRLAPGDQLPHEPALARALGVSRDTVNQALTLVTNRGLLKRRRGVGTFVSSPTIEQPLDHLYTFIRSVTAQNRTPGVRMLGSGRSSDEDARASLGLPALEPLFAIGRIRLVDGEPFIVEHFFTPAEIGEAVDIARLSSGEPIYDLIAAATGMRIDRAVETVRATTIKRAEATLLGVPAGSAGFEVVRRGFSGSRQIEFRRSLIRGDRYHFRIDLAGESLRESP